MSLLDFDVLTERFETYLSSHQPYGSPDTLYLPVRYINELGGKRVRPALLLMAYNLWHEEITPALPAALAIEYFHNFSLMHDDIMDEAPLRRGKQTVHTLFGRNSAILSGDAMLIRCFDLLLEAGKQKEIGAELCSVMARTSLEICEGQQMDMDFESLPSPSEPEYLEMIRKKTACLLGTSLRLGAMLAGASHHASDTLYAFGEKLGMGFQVQDDYLDVFGDSKLTGKQQGGDILRGKKNFLYVHTFNRLSPPERLSFSEKYKIAASTSQVQPILQLYLSHQVDLYTQNVQTEFVNGSLAQLSTLSGCDVTVLHDLANRLISRSN